MKRFILSLALLLSFVTPAFSQKVAILNQGEAEQFVVLRDKSVPVLGDLQAKYPRGSKPEMYVVDHRDGSKTTKAYLSKKPPSDKYPYFFLVEKGGLILAQGELPSTTKTTVAVVEKFQAKEKAAADVPPRVVMLQSASGVFLGGIVYVGGTQYTVQDVTIFKLPGPKPDPTPTPATTGPVWVTTIVDGRRVTPDQSSELIDLRDWLDKQDAAKVRRFEFSPDAKNERNELDPRVASWVARIPAIDRGKPYAFVTQATTADGKHVVLWQGPLTKADTLIEETKRRAKL